MIRQFNLPWQSQPVMGGMYGEDDHGLLRKSWTEGKGTDGDGKDGM